MRTAGLITAFISALGIGTWLWRRWRCRKKEESADALFPLLLGSGIVIRLLFVVFTPVFYAPDEEPHFNYIEHLSERQSFPVQRGNWKDGSKDWEYSQPPVYYLALVPVFRAAEAVLPNRTATVLSLRLCSVLFWLANIWLGLTLLKRLHIDDPAVRLFVMSLVCLLPTYTFVSAAINNDNLLVTLGGALLVAMAGPRESARWAFSCGLLLGLALLTKQSAVVFIPAFALLAALDCFSQRIKSRMSLGHLGVILGTAGLLYGPWAIRNFHVYGTFTPEYLVPDRIIWPSPPYGIASAIHNLVKSFFAVSGISNNIGYPFPLVGMLFLVLCVVWRRQTLTGQPKAEVLKLADNGPVLAAFLLALTMNVMLVLRFGFLFGMGQGRHLFPLLYPIGLLLATRWRLFPLNHLELHTAVAAIVYAFSFLLFSLWRFPER